MHYVILCGSETHPRTWQTVQSLISQQGRTCTIQDWGDISWEHGIDLALDAIADRIGRPPKVALVAHSVAGLFLPLLADRLQAVSEIYIAALTPKVGHSFFDRMFSDEDIFDHDWSIGYESLRHSTDPVSTHDEFLKHHLFHDCPSDTVRSSWVQSKIPLDRIYSFSYPNVQLTQRYRHYVICRDDRSICPQWQRLAGQTLCGDNTTIIDTGHCPQISRPQALVNLLLRAVQEPISRAF